MTLTCCCKAGRSTSRFPSRVHRMAPCVVSSTSWRWGVLGQLSPGTEKHKMVCRSVGSRRHHRSGPADGGGAMDVIQERHRKKVRRRCLSSRISTGWLGHFLSRRPSLPRKNCQASSFAWQTPSLWTTVSDRKRSLAAVTSLEISKRNRIRNATNHSGCHRRRVSGSCLRVVRIGFAIRWCCRDV